MIRDACNFGDAWKCNIDEIAEQTRNATIAAAVSKCATPPEYVAFGTVVYIEPTSLVMYRGLVWVRTMQLAPDDETPPKFCWILLCAVVSLPADGQLVQLVVPWFSSYETWHYLKKTVLRDILSDENVMVTN